MSRTLSPLRLGVLAAAFCAALPATAQLGGPAVPAARVAVDDVPPKEGDKRSEVTVWILDASGKG